MAAATAVFDTAELLETILLQLSLVDILRAQRVNKSFRDAIEESPSLQRALFFKPYGDFTARLTDSEIASKDLCFSATDCDKREEGPTRKPNEFNLEWPRNANDKNCDIVINPFLLKRNYIHILACYKYDLDKVSSKNTETSASWKSMLLSQPPVKFILISTAERRRHWHILKSDDDDAGLTLGHLQRFLVDIRSGPCDSTEIKKFQMYGDYGDSTEARLTSFKFNGASVLEEVENAVKGEEKPDIDDWWDSWVEENFDGKYRI